MFISSFRCSKIFKLAKLSRRLLATLRQSPMQQLQHQQQQHQHQQSLRNYTKEVKAGETFSTPRAPKDPPDDYKPTSFNHKAFDAPNFLPCSIFRQFSSPDEKLGPSAAKSAKYKNPEYYAYHRFSFVEMQKHILEIRLERICNDNAKCIYDYESDDEAAKKKDDSCADGTDGTKKKGGDGGKSKTGSSKNENKGKNKKAAPSSPGTKK